MKYCKQIKYFIVLAFFLQAGWSYAQSTTIALPNNGNSTRTNAPQGALRYQRGFYLIRQKEMLASGLKLNDTINCIGFTIGDAQSDTTRGKFKVYLQNTTDTLSRVDTTWQMVTGILPNYYKATGLFPGNYEWRVKTNCSAFSSVLSFSTDNLDPCQPPTHLISDSITASTAKLTWVAPSNTVSSFAVEYSRTDSVFWTRVSTSNNFYTISGLLPNKGYQWRIKTICPSDSSEFTSSTFSTERANKCNPPSALTVVSTTDTIAKLAWSGASGADYYSIRFRRAGSSQWIETITFTDSIMLNVGLDPGTIYQWQVRSNCGFDSVGVFVQGLNFTTTGTTACYAPEYFSVDSITSSSAKFTWDSVPGATSYQLWYRAKDIISWPNAINPMLLVHNDSILIPDKTGPYHVPFEGTGIGTFVYAGNGVYVAWEYKDSLGVLTTPNSSLSTTANTVLKGIFGQDSINYILSFIGRSDSSAIGLDTILKVTNMRPETRFCSPALKDSVEVLSVYALGQYAPLYTSAPISAAIRNYSGFAQTYAVTLTVKKQNSNTVRYTNTQNFLMGPDTIDVITFTGWVPALLETDSIIISIPGKPNENVLNNNRNFYMQVVNPSTVSYDDGSNRLAQAGTGTRAGYTLSRHLMDGCGKINAVKVYLAPSAQGHAVYGVVLDTLYNVIAQSSSFTPDSTQVNNYYTFYFKSSPVLQDEEYYIGLGQSASSPVGYFPVGVQWEGERIRDSAYYRFDIIKDSIWHQPAPGRLMIQAELIPGVAVPSITGDLFLCTGTMDTLTASSIIASYADSVIAFSSQYSNGQYSAREALGSPNVFPEYGTNSEAWLSGSDAGREFLVLRFSNPDSINFVDIFETFNPGAIDSVYLIDTAGIYHLIYSGTAVPAPQTARKNRITFSLTPYKVSGVRLAFNMAAVPGLSSVDAVCIGRITTPGVFSSILWTGGGTNPTLVVSAPGGYKLTTTDINGCMAMDSVTVITPITINPVIIAPDTTICPGDSIKLKSNQQGGNLWSNGSTADSIYVNTPGYHWVMFDDGTGCGITIDSIFLTLDTIPAVQITGDTSICPDQFTTLDAGNHTTYLWSTGATSDTLNVSIPGTYFVRVTNNNGCHGYDTVITTAGTSPNLMITGILLFCPADSTVLYAGTGYNTYLWSTGATSDSIYAKTAGTYAVTVSDSHGCEASDSVMVSLSVPVVPVISAADSALCPGDSVTLFSNQSINNVWSTGATTPSIVVSTAGSYFVTYDDGSGCGTTMSNSIGIIVDTIPVVQISGDTVICSGSSNVFDAGNHPEYLWSTGSNSNSISINAAGTFSVTVTDDNGCKGSDTITTILSTTPDPMISGALIFCPGDSTILKAGSGYSSYLWSGGATTDSISVNTAGVFSVTVTNAEGCTGDDVVLTSLYSPPIPVITGNDGFCPSDSVDIGVGAGYIDYLWSTGATTPGIVVNSAGNYSVTVTDNNGCKADTNKLVIQFTPPIAFISGTLSFCDGGSSTTLEAGLGFQSYLWSTGETSHSITVTSIGTYWVSVTDINGCSDSTSATVTLDGALPDVPGPITGDTTGMCNTNTPSIYFISPIPNSDCYFWKVPPGATIVSPDSMGTQIAVVFDNSFTGGYIEVSSHNACGNSPTFNGRRLYVSAFPGSIPGSISGQRSGVCKQLAAVYSIPNIIGATSYLWSVPLGAMITSGQGTPSIVVSFASSYRTGDICVQYSTLCGTGPFECISVDPRPITGNAITGPAVVCASTINTAYSIPLSVGANNYHWTVPTGATIVSGQGSNNIQVNFGNFSGLISVRASNDCGDGLFQFLLVNITPCNKVPRVPDLTIRKKQTGFSVSIFPNPSSGILNLDLQTEINVAAENYTLSVYDPLNQLLYSSKISTTSELRQTLDLRHFTKGIYFLQVKSKSQSYTTKILLH